MDFRKWSLSLILLSMFLTGIPMQAENNIPTEKISIEEAFSLIGIEYGVHFNYDRAVVADVEVNYETGQYKKVEDALRSVFSQTHLKYEIFDQRYVAVYSQDREGVESMKKMVSHFQEMISTSEDAMLRSERRVISPLATLSTKDVFSKRLIFSVSGTVTDQDGEPLIGVNIQVKDSNKGTATDFDGNFTLEDIGESAVLVVSYIGYQTQEVVVAGKSNLEIVMISDSQLLDEVVVVGYGTQQKRDLTGSVSRIDMSDKTQTPNVDVLQALSGAAAGVNIQGSGLAGTEPSITVRGQNSLSASNKPLIVLDDIIYEGSISDINVNDIESVNILKDASAAAIYGSRSSNGVVLITTKSGSSDKPLISFNSYYGLQDLTNNPVKFMNGEQYAKKLTNYYYQQELYDWYQTNPTSTDGKPQSPDLTDRELVASNLRTTEEKNNYLAGNEIDWHKEIRQPAFLQNYDLSVSGKANDTKYFLSGSMTNEHGILKNDKFSRMTVRSNIENKITDWLKIGLRASYSYRDYSGIEADNGWLQTGAGSASPLADNYIGSSDYVLYMTGENYMPYPLASTFADDLDIRNNLFAVGNAVVQFPWISGLSYEVNYSQTYMNRTHNTYYPKKTKEGQPNNGRAEKNPEEYRNWIVNNIFTYSNNFGVNNINITGLYSREHRHGELNSMIVENFANSVLGFNNMKLGTKISPIETSAWEENSISYMMRVNYSYMFRYLLTATWRRDGFSGFSPEHKYANFPSISLGWIMSEEKFFQNFFNENNYLKLKFSIGRNGNQGIGRYSSFTRMEDNAYTFGSSSSVGVVPSELGNAELGWETTTSVNVGFDFGIVKNRINGSLDFYTGLTKDVLVKRRLPRVTGYSDIWANLGSLENNGIEIEIESLNIDDKSLRWSSNFVFSLNRSKIKSLYGDGTERDIGNSWFKGEPITAIYDYEISKDGVWTEEELFQKDIYENWYPGQFKYVDQNADGKIDANNDRIILGYEEPSFRFSIGNSLSYKNLSFSILINAIQGGKNYYLQNNDNMINVDWNSNTVMRINAPAIRPYWTPENGVTNATGVFNAPILHGGIYESRSFVRVQDISLSYDLGSLLSDSTRIGNFQIYFASKNAFTFSKWSGWDPEVGNSNFPLLRNYVLGVNISF